jgi:hypothetical protein
MAGSSWKTCFGVVSCFFGCIFKDQKSMGRHAWRQRRARTGLKVVQLMHTWIGDSQPRLVKKQDQLLRSFS